MCCATVVSSMTDVTERKVCAYARARARVCVRAKPFFLSHLSRRTAFAEVSPRVGGLKSPRPLRPRNRSGTHAEIFDRGGLLGDFFL